MVTYARAGPVDHRRPLVYLLFCRAERTAMSPRQEQPSLMLLTAMTIILPPRRIEDPKDLFTVGVGIVLV